MFEDTTEDMEEREKRSRMEGERGESERAD